jgi:hypothetical protein
MSDLKQQVFGDHGFTADMRLRPDELALFRRLIGEHWLATIAEHYPDLLDEARVRGIDNYHLLTDRIDHRKTWPKASRVLPQASVEQIKSLPFLRTLREAFGDFEISDVYDTHQHHGHEEIYWRLVRPDAEGDIGPLHADTWFHGAFNMGYGMFADGVVTVKIWVPVFCEPGKSGLAIVAGSHLRDWQHHMDTSGGSPRPVLDEDPATIDATLIPTEPGNMLIFNERTLHGGVVNRGLHTRVSAEITMVLAAAPHNTHQTERVN